MIHKNKRLSQIDFEFSLFLFVYNIPRILKAILPAVGGRYLDRMNLKEFI